MLLSHRVLDDRPVEPLFRPSRMYLHLVFCLVRLLLLDGVRAHLVEPNARSFPAWVRRGCQIHDYPRVRCGVLAGQYPRYASFDIGCHLNDGILNALGALVMMWQMWTAFGIMLGFIASVAFMDVTNATIPGLNWRLMLGSTAIP